MLMSLLNALNIMFRNTCTQISRKGCKKSLIAIQLLVWSLILFWAYFVAPNGEALTTTYDNQCKFVFALHDSAILVLDEQGQELHRIDENAGFNPVWSPDGTQIAFISSGLTHDLCIFNIVNDKRSCLSENLYNFDYPTWSPDGTQIAFISDFGVEPEEETKLYMIDSTGGQARRLGDLPGFYNFPSWSPDGTQIAFTREYGEKTDIYLIGSDGTNLHILARDGSLPQWSPDGTKIAFVSRRHGQTDIYVINVDGNDERKLTNNEADDYSPDWSPDGKQLVFVSEQAGNGEIYVINEDGSNMQRLTKRDADDLWPDWSPNGQWIVFQSNAFNKFWQSDIWLINSDGTKLKRLTQNELSDPPFWSPGCTS